jgi:hypothetical protein
MRIAESVREHARCLERWFFGPADARAYAALRIGYATAALLILLDLWPERHVLLASTGLFGGALPFGVAARLNVFVWARSEAAVTAVMVFAAFAIVCLAIGFLPRLAAIATYIWVRSYADTNPLALAGFDTILRVIGFVLIISPTVSTWSVAPSWAKGSTSPPLRYGLRLVQWQLMLIYTTTVWLKAPDPFWRKGEAVTYFMMSIFARSPDPIWAHLRVVGAVLTYGTLLIEVTVPFLLWMRRTRAAGVFLGASLHIGIALGSDLGLFSLAIVPLYFAFFEREDFEWIASWFPPPGAPSQKVTGSAGA